MKRLMTPLATVAGIAVMVACACAQEAPANVQNASTQSKDKQAQKVSKDKKQTQKSTEAGKPADAASADAKDAKDDAEAAPLRNYLSFGYTTWKSNGYLTAIHQNGQLPSGFGLDTLSVRIPNEKQSAYFFDFNGGDSTGDYGVRLKAQWGGSTQLLVTSGQYSYFNPAIGNDTLSRDQKFGLTLEQSIAPNFGAFVTYSQDSNNHYFQAPVNESSYMNRVMAAGVQKQVGEHTFGASYSETRYSDISGTPGQPVTLTDRGELRYLGNWGSRLSTEGSVALTKIQQEGYQPSWIRDYSLSGVYDVTDSSSLGASVMESVLQINNTADAYLRKKLDSGVKYDFRLGHWGVDLGYGHREEERVRMDHSYVDVPKWNTWNLKINGRLTPSVQLGLKGQIEELQTSPVFDTEVPDLLYWSRKSMGQLKLNTGSDTTAGYLTATYRYRDNSIRQQHVGWWNVAVGGSRVFNSKLLGYAEFASDNYNVGGAAKTASLLSGYFPASETFMFGLDYTRNSRESLSCVMTNFYTQDQWGQQIAVTYRLDMGKERNLQITYSPWLQKDRLYNVDNFDAAILAVKLGTRF